MRFIRIIKKSLILHLVFNQTFMNFLKFSSLSFLLVLSMINFVEAQDVNPVMTAVPFLMIAPDARGGALGDAGVSTSPDANSMHWNPAKLAFIDKDMGFSVSYSPWLKKLVQDINLAYLAGYKRIDKNSVVGFSLCYFDLGGITFTNENGEVLGNYNPKEFSIDGGYSRLLAKNFSMAVSARFIHSNLTEGQMLSGGYATKPGNSVAADIGIYHHLPVKLNQTDGVFAWGVNISNLGSKISYTDGNEKRDFIPTNLRFGPSLTLDIDDFNSVAVMIDINKLLVPTPPTYKGDSIDKGLDPNVSPVVGLIHSFYDAPGGFSEEIKEYSISGGLEYWYDKQFAIRGGAFYEDRTKGDRKFVTLGAGLRYNVFGLDFSYLIPIQQTNPLASTIRFCLVVNFDNIGK
jgi:hypothetical protein